MHLATEPQRCLYYELVHSNGIVTRVFVWCLLLTRSLAMSYHSNVGEQLRRETAHHETQESERRRCHLGCWVLLFTVKEMCPRLLITSMFHFHVPMGMHCKACDPITCPNNSKKNLGD